MAAVETARRPARGSIPRTGLFGAGAVVALVAAFTVQFVEGGLIVLLPLELERLGVAPEALPGILGVGFSATYLAATIAAAVGGRLAAKRPPLSVLCVVLLLGLVALAPLAFAQTWWQFVGLRVLLALAVGAAPTLLYAAAATLAPPDQRGKLVGMVSSAGIFGWAASPLVAGALAHEQSAVLLGLDAGLYALLAVALLAAERGFLDRLGRSQPARPHRPALRPYLAVPRGLLGRLSGPSLALPGRPSTRRFTADEVITVLRGTARGKRADAVLDVASRPAVWMPADPQRVFGDAPRYADRLPTILHWYRAGDDPETIGRRLSPLGGRWAVERTVETAAGLIAEHLNR
jgi:MFS family permease